MSVISSLKDAILKKDWDLVDAVLQTLAGISVEQRVVKNNPLISEKINSADDSLNKFMVNTNSIVREKTDITPVNNKNVFYDDKTLDMDFAEMSQKSSPKKYRAEVDESTFFKSAKCSRCGSTMNVAAEEFAFKSRDSESSGFVCVPCMKRAKR